MSFSALRLAEPIVRAVTAKGYTSTTDIQAGAIPPAIEGRDVLGTAQTGTGKTCAFALPILQRLSQNTSRPPRRKRNGSQRHRRVCFPRALVLCPTRELATQIHGSFSSYGHHLQLNYAVVYGGVKQYHQVRSMRHGADVLVATPGRLKDLVQQGIVDLSAVETLVLDEADRMLDMGFIADIRQIEAMTSKGRQTLLFSATISDSIRKLAREMMRDPEVVETATESTTVDSVDQRVIMVEQPQKVQLLAHVLGGEGVHRAVVFTRTKYGADKVARRLKQCGLAAEAIHSNKTQSARNATMQEFRSGAVHVLVATDIASRGIDVQAISHVVNFDMPIDPETYVHRIGRTARAGASGKAITFCCRNQRKMLRAIERRASMTLPPAERLPKMAPLPHIERPEQRATTEPQARATGPKKRNGRKPAWKSRGKQEGTRTSAAAGPHSDARRRSRGKPEHTDESADAARTGGYRNRKGGKPKAPRSGSASPSTREDAQARSGGKKKFRKGKGGKARAAGGAASSWSGLDQQQDGSARRSSRPKFAKKGGPKRSPSGKVKWRAKPGKRAKAARPVS